jgi:hypothetical protein
MDSNSIIIVLAVVTLAIGIVVGIVQVMRTRRSKRKHEHSSLASTPGLRERNEPPPGRRV